jgi:hypothetical protein
MMPETRVGLLVGVLFIVAFGLIISELTLHEGAPVAARSEASAPPETIWSPTAMPMVPVLDEPKTQPAAAETIAEVATPPPPPAAAQTPAPSDVAALPSDVIPLVVDPPADNAVVASAAPDAPELASAPLAAIAKPAAPAGDEGQTGKVYTVQAGDTLSKIAAKM